MTGTRSATTGRRVLVAVAIATVLVGGVIVATVPRGEQEQAITAETTEDAVVHVTIIVEAIDAKVGTMRVTVVAQATRTGDLPADGLSVLADIEGMAPLRVLPDALTLAEGEGEIRFDQGTIGAYPFDRYDGTIGLLAVKGAPNTMTDAFGSDSVPLSLTVIESTTGFDLEARPDDQAGDDAMALVLVSYTATRTPPVVVWASIMMAIYWLLTAAVVAVVLVTALGVREWETRHLAWLAAMIFAFTSFRAAAPDSPPIGVYFDFASFFWAELIVAVCLATLVVKYLIGRGVAGADAPEVPGDDGHDAGAN